MNPVVEPAPARRGEEELAAWVQTSRDAWRRVGLRLRSVTPSGLVRVSLIAGALASLAWIATR